MFIASYIEIMAKKVVAVLFLQLYLMLGKYGVTRLTASGYIHCAAAAAAAAACRQLRASVQHPECRVHYIVRSS